MVDYCYGNIRAAVRLEQILDELATNNPAAARKHRAKIGSIFTDCNMVLQEMDRTYDKRVFEMMWQAWYAELMKRINECVLPQNMKNHLRGAIKAVLRNKYRSYLIRHKDTGKNRRKKLAEILHKHDVEFERLRKKVDEQERSEKP
jgi:hypothetical protein